MRIRLPAYMRIGMLASFDIRVQANSLTYLSLFSSNVICILGDHADDVFIQTMFLLQAADQRTQLLLYSAVPSLTICINLESL